MTLKDVIDEVKKDACRFFFAMRGPNSALDFDLELAKKPPACLELIVVHEMVHLLERHHDARFQARMDNLMPTWRRHREELNHAPLAHEKWRY